MVALGDLSPPGKGPECRGTAAWARHPLAAFKLMEGASKSQRRAGGDAVGGVQGYGAQPNPWREASTSNKIQCSKRLARPRSGLNRVYCGIPWGLRVARRSRVPGRSRSSG